MRSIVLIAFISLAVAGCATPYGSPGLTGGVTAEAVGPDTYRILAYGNGFTNAATIQDFATLKAAEIAKSAGGTHFIVVNSKGETQTLLSPGLLMPISKPSQEIFIRVLKGPAPSALSADEVIATIGPRVKRS